MVRNLGIKSKLALGFIIFAFIPMAALGYLLFHNVKSEVLKKTEDNAMSVTKSLDQDIEIFIAHHLEYIKFISRLPHVASLVASMADGDLNEITRDAIRGTFQTALLSNKDFDTLFLLHPETGEVLSSTMPHMEGMFFNRRPYFHMGKKGPSVYRVHYSHAHEKNILAMAVPLIHRDRLLGVIAAWINVSELNDFIENAFPIKSYLVTRANIHILGTGSSGGGPFQSGIFTVGATKALAGETGSEVYEDVEGNKVVGAYTLLDTLDIALISEIPLADALAAANREGLEFLGMTLGIAILVLTASIMLGNHITEPIIGLTRKIKDFGKSGTEEALKGPRSGIEVAELTAAFNRLLASRMEIEEALRKSEEKYRLVFSTGQDAIIILDPASYRIMDANDAATHVYGYSREEMRNMTGPELSAEKEKSAAAIKHVSISFEKHHFQTRTHKKKDGTVFPVEISSSTFAVHDTKLICAFIRDITERVRADEALRESEEKARAISDASTDSIMMIDGEGIITYVNHASLRLLGYTSEELIGSKLHNLIVSEDARRQYDVALPEFKKSGLCSVVGELHEVYATRKDGMRVPVEISVASLYMKGEWYSAGIMRDITERKKIERTLRDIAEKVSVHTGEEFFRSLTEFVAEELAMEYALVGELDSGKNKVKTISIYARGTFIDNIEYDLLRSPCENVMGKKACVYPDNIQKLFPEDTLLADMKTESYAGVPLFASDGRPLGIIVVLGCRPLPEEKMEQAVTMMKIFSARAAAELERTSADEKLENLNKDLAQKNKELQQVLYVTSHDLRSPLVNIEGFSRELELSLQQLSDLMNRGGVSHEVRAETASIIQKDIPVSMEYIRSSTKKMELLLTGLLRLSRIGRTELKKVRLNMNRIMSAVVRNFEFRLQKAGAAVEVLELPPCTGDEIHIDQLFSNLIDNAIKYIGHERPGIIKISGYSDNESSVYCVEDNGMGIAPAYQDKIFEIFERLEPDKQAGEGLGLTIAHRIVQMHGGTIWIESDVGQGSKFFVSLPV